MLVNFKFFSEKNLDIKMIPRTLDEYAEMLRKFQREYNQVFEMFHFNIYELSISELSPWIITILTSICYNNEEKDKFMHYFLMDYLKDETIRINSQELRIVFVNYKYHGCFHLNDVEKMTGKNIICHEITEITQENDDVEIESRNKPVSLLIKDGKKWKPNGEEILGKKLEYNCSLEIENNGIFESIFNARTIIDSGASFSSLNCPEMWDKNFLFL